MSTPGPFSAKRLMIYLGESDSWRGHSLYIRILETLRREGIAGATVTRAIAGYGAHSRIRTNTLEVLSTDLPIVISVIDTPDNIDRALTLVGPMVREGLITVENVQIVKYTHRYLHPLPADRAVGDSMTRNVITVMASTPAREVVELLLAKMLKAVPVVNEDRRVVGIISTGDLLRKAGLPARLAVGERLQEDDLRSFLAQVSRDKIAQEIMTSPVIMATEDEALGHAVQRLVEHNLKRLPVVDAQNRLVGMLSRLDVLRAVVGAGTGEQEQAPMPHYGRTIGELMSPDVPTVHSNDDLSRVLELMLRADIKRVIVQDNQDHPIGIITDGDVVERVSPATRRNVLQSLAAKVLGTDLNPGNISAHELMSQEVLAAPKETSVIDAIGLMLREKRKRLVVIDEAGHPIGIVDRQTLMAASLGR